VNRRRKRTIALTLSQLEPGESWCHAFQYGDNYLVMANIASPSEPYGENHFGMAKIIWGRRARMAEINYK
jgi:hypothetical protein